MIYLAAGVLGVLAVISGIVLGVARPGSGGLFIAAAGALFAGLSAIGQIRERRTSARRLEEEKAADELAERAELRRQEAQTKGPDITQASALRFVSISLADTTYWYEVPRDGHRRQIFDRKTEQYFTSGHVSGPQLIFDLTIMNRSGSQPYILREVGVRWTALCRRSYYYGPPQAAAIRPAGQYALTCHRERFDVAKPYEYVEVEPGDYNAPPEIRDAEPIDAAIDESVALPDPIYMEPHAPFRFTLELEDYAKAVPNHALIRFWIRSDAGIAWSQEVEVFTS